MENILSDVSFNGLDGVSSSSENREKIVQIVRETSENDEVLPEIVDKSMENEEQIVKIVRETSTNEDSLQNVEKKAATNAENIVQIVRETSENEQNIQINPTQVIEVGEKIVQIVRETSENEENMQINPSEVTEVGEKLVQIVRETSENEENIQVHPSQVTEVGEKLVQIVREASENEENIQVHPTEVTEAGEKLVQIIRETSENEENIQVNPTQVIEAGEKTVQIVRETSENETNVPERESISSEMDAKVCKIVNEASQKGETIVKIVRKSCQTEESLPETWTESFEKATSFSDESPYQEAKLSEIGKKISEKDEKIAEIIKQSTEKTSNISEMMENINTALSKQLEPFEKIIKINLLCEEDITYKQVSDDDIKNRETQSMEMTKESKTQNRNTDEQEISKSTSNASDEETFHSTSSSLQNTSNADVKNASDTSSLLQNTNVDLKNSSETSTSMQNDNVDKKNSTETVSTRSLQNTNTTEQDDLRDFDREEREKLSSEQNLETKLEVVYENGRVVEDQNNFEVILNVRKFLQGSMNVKSKGFHIFLVDCEATDPNDTDNKIYLTKRFFIPGRVDMQKTKTSLSSDGILVITVPKLPEFVIPKRSDDSSSEIKLDSTNLKSEESLSTESKSESKSGSPMPDLDRRFRDSEERIRTESPSKLEELEARIKSRKENKMKEESSAQQKSEEKSENNFDSKVGKESDKTKFNINIDRDEKFSRAQKDKYGDDDDFFSDSRWSRKRASTDDWVKDYVKKFVDEEDWFNDSRDKDFFGSGRSNDERKKYRRDFLESRIQDDRFGKFSDRKDMFGSKYDKFFEDDDFGGVSEFMKDRRSKKESRNKEFDNLIRSHLDDFDKDDFSWDRRSKREKSENETPSTSAGNKGNTQEFRSSKESRSEFSSSASTGNKEPEIKRDSKINKEEYSSSSADRSEAKSKDDDFRKYADEIKDSFKKESDFTFDFPIVRRGNFFKDTSFNDAKDDFDAVIDRFRSRNRRSSAFKSRIDDEDNLKEIKIDKKKQKTVLSEDQYSFKIELPVAAVDEKTLSVKQVTENEIVIEGKHKDGPGIFKKQIMFPINDKVNLRKTTSILTKDGVLSIKVPKSKCFVSPSPSSTTSQSYLNESKDPTSFPSTKEENNYTGIHSTSESVSTSGEKFTTSDSDRPTPRSRQSSVDSRRNYRYCSPTRSISPPKYKRRGTMCTDRTSRSISPIPTEHSYNITDKSSTNEDKDTNYRLSESSRNEKQNIENQHDNSYQSSENKNNDYLNKISNLSPDTNNECKTNTYKVTQADKQEQTTKSGIDCFDTRKEQSGIEKIGKNSREIMEECKTKSVKSREQINPYGRQVSDTSEEEIITRNHRYRNRNNDELIEETHIKKSQKSYSRQNTGDSSIAEDRSSSVNYNSSDDPLCSIKKTADPNFSYRTDTDIENFHRQFDRSVRDRYAGIDNLKETNRLDKKFKCQAEENLDYTKGDNRFDKTDKSLDHGREDVRRFQRTESNFDRQKESDKYRMSDRAETSLKHQREDASFDRMFQNTKTGLDYGGESDRFDRMFDSTGETFKHQREDDKFDRIFNRTGGNLEHRREDDRFDKVFKKSGTDFDHRSEDDRFDRMFERRGAALDRRREDGRYNSMFDRPGRSFEHSRDIESFNRRTDKLGANLDHRKEAGHSKLDNLIQNEIDSFFGKGERRTQENQKH